MQQPDASRVSTSLAVTTTGDSQTFTYPTGTGPDSFAPAGNHKITGADVTELLSNMGHITVTFTGTGITVVNNTDRTFRAGATYVLDLDLAGYDDEEDPIPVATAFEMSAVRINLGAPAAADADGAVASQACTAASGLATGINGALASGGVATFDKPRNVVAAWTGTAVLTVTGTDEYGETIVESSASGTSLAGKKAFKTVTGVSTSADITGLTVGTGDVLGLPIFLEAPIALGEIQDGAKATAGTIVAGVTTAATATTGDVRGTYDPNAACDGSKVFELDVLVRAKSFKGVAQYGG